MQRQIILIAHDIRSTHNVGSLLRTAEGLGVKKVYFTGYTPYPISNVNSDNRLAHIAQKLNKQIHKTALNAENLILWEHTDIETCLQEIQTDNYTLVGLEQSDHSIPLPDFTPPTRVAILLGREVEGIDTFLLERCSTLVEIPMFGQKESFNVIQAAAIMLYHCQFIST